MAQRGRDPKRRSNARSQLHTKKERKGKTGEKQEVPTNIGKEKGKERKGSPRGLLGHTIVKDLPSLEASWGWEDRKDGRSDFTSSANLVVSSGINGTKEKGKGPLTRGEE